MAGFMDMGLQGIRAAFLTISTGAIVVASGNLFVGEEITPEGSPTSQIVIANGTLPDATTDGYIFIGAKDASADSKSTFSLYAEQEVETEALSSDTTLRVWINGVAYKLLLYVDD